MDGQYWEVISNSGKSNILLISDSLLAPGSSSFVYCVDKTQAVKKFNSIGDLLNEQTVYDILPRDPRLVNPYKFGADYMIMDRMPNGDLARFIETHPEVAQRRKLHWVIQI